LHKNEKLNNKLLKLGQLKTIVCKKLKKNKSLKTSIKNKYQKAKTNKIKKQYVLRSHEPKNKDRTFC